MDNGERSAWDIFRYLIIAGLVIFGLWYWTRSSVEYTTRQCEGKTMGTNYTVKVYAIPETENWAEIQAEIQACLDRIDGAMSTFKPKSDVCRFNESESDDWFLVQSETAEVVELAQEIAQLTGGAFDITIAPLVNLWGFGPNKTASSEEELLAQTESLRNRIGYTQLEVQKNPPALKKLRPDLTIDLSGIAKGYAVDAVGRLLEARLIGNYMIEIGGEVRCRGQKILGKNNENVSDWTIGIEKPLLATPGSLPGLQRAFPLRDKSLATSGDYLNYRQVGQTRYSHILDPRTGFPTERIAASESTPVERLGSVSVLAEDCARADALATAFFVLGETEGMVLAKEQKIPVLFLFRTENKETPIRELASPDF